MNSITAGLIVCLLFIHTTVYSQLKVSGAVYDKNNIPSRFSSLILLKDSVQLQSAAADSAGYYSLAGISPGTYTLVCSFLGTKQAEKTLSLQRDTIINFILDNDQVQSLKEVQVTAKGKILEQTGDKLIFNVENSALKQGYNGLDLIRRAPKLQVNANGDIQIRRKEAMVLVNGRKVNLSGADLNTYLSSLDAENIKSIEIQDVASSETDAANSGGVINIVLKRMPKGFKVIARTSYDYRKEDYMKYAGNANINYGAEKWNAYISSGYSDNKDWASYNTGFDYFKKNEQQKQDGDVLQKNNSFDFKSGFVAYPDKKNEFGAEFYYNKLDAAYTNVQQFNIYNPEHSTSSVNHSLISDKTGMWYATVNYMYKTDSTGSNIKFIGDIGRNKIERDNDISTRYSLGDYPNLRNLFATAAPSDYYTLQLDWTQKLKKGWQLLSGVKYGSVKRDNRLHTYLMDIDGHWVSTPDDLENFYNRENILAGYASTGKTIVDRHYLKFGLRAEHTTVNGLNRINQRMASRRYLDFFPNFFYSYDLKKDRGISFSYRRSVQRPSFRDLNPFIIKQNDFLYQYGNPYLVPQYNQRIDITYQTAHHALSGFALHSDDVIQYVYYLENDINYVQPRNFGQEQSYGLDHSYTADVSKWLYVDISSGIYYTDFQSGVLEASRPSFYNYIHLQVKLPRNFLFELFNKYDYKYQFRNVVGADLYGMDVSLRKMCWNDKVIAKLSVNDVFNTRRDKNQSVYQDFNFDFYQKRLTRYFSLSLQYTFSNKGKVKDKFIKSENQSRYRL
jgi:hypothetical protein